MILLANFIAGRFRFSRWLYLPLIASILLVYSVASDDILSLSYGGRLAWTVLVVPIPIFLAGLIFSGTFRRAKITSASFGANLLGAMVGGFAEYLSMASGRASLVFVIIGAYLLSLLATLALNKQMFLSGSPAGVV
jgi:hypothetical protein